MEIQLHPQRSQMQIQYNRLFATVLYCYKKSMALIHLSTEDCQSHKEHELGHVIIKKQELQYYTGSKGPYDQNNFPAFFHTSLKTECKASFQRMPVVLQVSWGYLQKNAKPEHYSCWLSTLNTLNLLKSLFKRLQ